MNMTFSPLAPGLNFGTEVRGLELGMLADQVIRQQLQAAWIEYGMIIFRDLEGEEMHLALSRCFGTLIAHPTKETRAAHPELMTVRYRPDTGWLMSVNGEPRGSWLPWHSDLIYVNRINRGGISRPVKVPSHLGQTGFIDKIDSYDRLPERLKRRVDGLSVIYKYNLDPGHQKFGRTAHAEVTRFSPDVLSIQARLEDFARSVHPMVYAQSETGRKMLNVSPWFAVGIQGMENADGDALLEEVAQHIVQSPHVYQHDWKLGDMVLWDNWRLLHSSAGSPPDEERWLLRTTIEGDYGLGSVEAGGDATGRSYISI